MRTTSHGRKATIALLACVAALVTMASPSAAHTVNVTWTITGHINTHWDGATRLIDDPNPPPPVCVTPGSTHPQVVTHWNDTSTTTAAVHINGATAYSGFSAADINIAGTNYQALITGSAATTTGAVNLHTGAATATVGLHLRVLSCDGATTLCTVPVSVPVTGTYSGGAHPATGDTLTGTGSASAPINPSIGCNVAIRAAIFGSTVSATITLTAH